ncbi:MAG: hypothetical protein WCS94_24445, partial [Verrucomicrobiota bacterium]
SLVIFGNLGSLSPVVERRAGCELGGSATACGTVATALPLGLAGGARLSFLPPLSASVLGRA